MPSQTANRPVKGTRSKAVNLLRIEGTNAATALMCKKLHPTDGIGSLVGLAVRCTDANDLRSILA
jgi:hypothetical protein